MWLRRYGKFQKLFAANSDGKELELGDVEKLATDLRSFTNSDEC